ncbi:peroxiredoxin [Bacillus piscicola]|uniref:peroxiredoxin n=1 Tax=Bacillus piscicola TaxID=1632684 RepID=UPI001F091640|nr:peroxiredoxin [Bacillus piscicola]
MTEHFLELPDDLPEPQDDGACNHLKGKEIPSVTLHSTTGESVDLSQIKGRLVLYFYPLTGKPGVSLPSGWNDIPGARGCTAQACSIRDHFQELQKLNTKVFGVSTQRTEYQKELTERLHLPYQLVSDSNLALSNALNLPLFEVDSMTLIKRLTLIVQDGIIEKVFYPVFPPDKNIDEVVEWLSAK